MGRALAGLPGAKKAKFILDRAALRRRARLRSGFGAGGRRRRCPSSSRMTRDIVGDDAQHRRR
jgi:hypothetical protein